MILRVSGGGLSHPCISEAGPGQLWVSALFGARVALRLCEADFAK